MDQLETQVSDLRSFLSQDPLAPTLSPQEAAFSPAGPLRSNSHHSSFSARGDNSAPQPLSPRESRSSATPTTATAAAKRRADDADAESAAKQQRSKRNRYISLACNECKRRKIKCNGQTPCQRCGHLNLECLYAPNCCPNFKDSDEFKQLSDHVSHLQHQVNTLFDSLNLLRRDTLRLAPLSDHVLSQSSATVPLPASSRHAPIKDPVPFRVPQSYHGPTSIGFTVDVAKNTLHKMGYSAGCDGNEDGYPQPDSPVIAPANLPTLTPNPADPIWDFNESEMLHLCKIYEEEVGAMYPVIKIGPVVEHAKAIAAWVDAKRSGMAPPHAREHDLLDVETLQLKIVLCCALTIQEHGNSAKAARLYESIQPTVDKMLMTEPTDVARLPFLALCAGYRWLSNDEILAWRVIGQVARMCLELGLHRREGLDKIADPLIRRNALHTFWSAYVLDRRWSFSTGLPFVCHDDKIDPKLPYPDSYPFLVAMIGYSKLGAKVWKLVDCFEPAVVRELKPHDFEELDREIMSWYESVPEDLRIGPLECDKMPVPAGPSYDVQRLRIWLRLRLNQVRIWLYTPILHSATSIVQNEQLARKVVDLAKQTIRILTHLNRNSDLYRRSQVFYHQFLTSSIAVLFLASTHAPLKFSATCRGEFYMALDMVKDMSARSWVSKCLWRTIRSLRAYARRLGLEEDSSRHAGPVTGPALPSTQPHESSNGSGPGSAVGLTRPFDGRPAVSSPIDNSPTHPMPLQKQVPAEDETNGLRLHDEMSRIYEYMGSNTARELGSPTVISPGLAYSHSGPGAAIFGGDEIPAQGDCGVYQHMRGMF